MASENLQIKITAIDKTKQAFNSLANKLGGLKKAAGVVGIAVGAIGAAFVAAAKKTIDFADEIAKTADKVGLSTSALQELRVATDLAGISQSELDTALGALSKRLGELRLGTGALKTVLDKSGDSFGSVLSSTTSNEEAFRLIIRRLGSYTNAQDRAALAAAAFGRSAGIALSKLRLEDLDQGIEQARKLGLIIDEDLLRNAEGIKDQFTLASRVIQTQFMEAMLRVMREIDFSSLAKDVAKLTAEFFAAAVQAAKFLGIIDRPRAEKIQRLKDEISRMSSEFAAAAARADELDGSVLGNQARDYMVSLTKSIKAANAELSKLEEGLRVDITPPKFERPPAPKPEQTAIPQMNQMIEVAKDMEREFQLPKTALEELKEKAQDTFSAMQNIGVRAMGSLEDSIMGVMDGTKSLKEAFSDMATSILNDLIRMQIQKSITGPLSGFLNQGLGSLFGGGASTGTFNGGFDLVSGFADGGVTSSRRPYMVGEKGPEMFVPNMTGRVVPNNAIGGGAVTVNVINNTGADTRTEEREGPNGSKSIDIFIDEAVARNISTPGSRTGRAMRNSFAGLSPQLAGR
jgi:hypothetical protein